MSVSIAQQVTSVGFFSSDDYWMMTTELEEKFRELSSVKSVRGVFILNSDGAAVKSSLDAKTTDSFGTVIHEVMTTAKKLFSDLDENNRDELTFTRFRTRKHEVMVAPDKNFLLVVIHHPQDQ